MSPIGLLQLTAFVSVLLIVVILSFRHLWTGKSSFRSTTVNVCVLLFTLLYSSILAELLLSTVFLRSYESGFNVFEKRWEAEYWKPINSLGYRDIDHPESDFSQKKTIFVVGDSFAAGYGIKDYRNRFASIVQDKLGDGWSVITIAENGWGTSLSIRLS
jgi:hypothetical protein